MSLPAELTRGEIGGGSGQLRTRARRLAGARAHVRGRGHGRGNGRSHDDNGSAGASASSSALLGGTRMMPQQHGHRRPRKIPPLKPLSLPTFVPGGTPITAFSASAALEEQYVASTTAGTGDFGSRYMRLRSTVSTALDALPVDDDAPSRGAGHDAAATLLHDNRAQLGIMCFKMGKYEEALTHLAPLYSECSYPKFRHGHSADIARTLGLVYLRLGMLDEAQQLYRDCVTSGPEWGARLGLVTVLQGKFARGGGMGVKALSKSNEAGVVVVFAQLKRLANDNATAMALVRKVVSSHPHNVEALIELGRLLLAKGAYYEAMSNLARALQLWPGDALALEGMAQAYGDLGLPRARLAALERACHHCPHDQRLHSRLTMALLEVGRPLEAYRTIMAFCDSHPTTDGLAYNCVVIAGKFLGYAMWDKCEQLARMVLDMNPDPRTESLAWAMIGESCVQSQGERGNSLAMDALERSYAADPSNDGGVAPLVEVYKTNGYFDKALPLYEAMAKRKPLDAAVHFNQAQCQEYAIQYDGAVKVLTECLRRVPLARHPTSVQLHALPLLLVKLLFCGPHPYDWLPLAVGWLNIIHSYRPDMVLQLRSGVRTHWAYAFFIQKLLEKSGMPELPPAPPLPTPKRSKSSKSKSRQRKGKRASGAGADSGGQLRGLPPNQLHIMGDSHCLAYAWRTVEFRGQERVLVPHVLTGLKVWHMQPGTHFLTHSNMLHALKELDSSVEDLLFTAGEIDVREGLFQATRKGVYNSIEDAVANTVYIYVQSLLWIRSMYPRLRLWVLPIVPPPSVPLNPGQDRLYATALFNEMLKRTIDAQADVLPATPPARPTAKRGSGVRGVPREPAGPVPKPSRGKPKHLHPLRFLDFGDSLYGESRAGLGAWSPDWGTTADGDAGAVASSGGDGDAVDVDASAAAGAGVGAGAGSGASDGNSDAPATKSTALVVPNSSIVPGTLGPAPFVGRDHEHVSAPPGTRDELRQRTAGVSADGSLEPRPGLVQEASYADVAAAVRSLYGRVLKEDLACDGTHTNAAVVPVMGAHAARALAQQ